MIITLIGFVQRSFAQQAAGAGGRHRLPHQLPVCGMAVLLPLTPPFCKIDGGWGQ